MPVFFVISGYCISATAAAATVHRNGSTIDYFIRRLRRIYSPYLIVFAFTALIKTAVGRNLLPTPLRGLLGKLGDTVAMSPSQWWGNATLTESWRYLAFGDARKYLLEYSWTLCYVEQFYLLFGLFLIFAGRRFYAAALLLSEPILGWQILSAATAERFDARFSTAAGCFSPQAYCCIGSFIEQPRGMAAQRSAAAGSDGDRLGSYCEFI